MKIKPCLFGEADNPKYLQICFISELLKINKNFKGSDYLEKSEVIKIRDKQITDASF